ncbi:MAG: hypothetical protein QOE60_330, partial [Thermoleophilaceae bacterium]|nr:hypothetical protein [Thermoleophilaceae bacterium]
MFAIAPPSGAGARRPGPTGPSEILAVVLGRLREGIHEVRMVVGGHTPTHEHLRSRIMFITVTTVALDVVASVLIFFFERHAPGTEITNI